MSEVEKLKQYCIDNHVVNMGVTTAYELGLTDKKPTAEEIAGEINRVHEWLSDPVNRLTSLIGGHVMLKKDKIMCLEKRTGKLEDGSWGPISMTKEEKWEVRELKKDVELFERSVNMIKELSENDKR